VNPSLTNTGDTSSYSPFPSDFIDPLLKKEKKYNLDYAKAAYFEWVKDVQLLTNTRRNDFVDNRLYAEGNQNNTKYKKPYYKKDDKTNEEYSYVDLDYTPVSVLPAYRDIVINYLEKLEYDIDFVAVDPISDRTRDFEVYKIWADKQLETLMQQEGIQMQLTGAEEELYPQTKEELEIFRTMCHKLKWEIAMKGIIDLDFYRNDWPQIRRKIYEDLFDNGIAGSREFTTKAGRHILRYVDPVNLYVRQTRDKECKGSNAIGEVVEMTLSDLVAQAGDQFTEEEYKQIAKTATRPYSSTTSPDDFLDTDTMQAGGWLSWYTGRYGDMRVKMFDLTWMTVDRHFYEKKMNAAGTPMVYKKPYGHTVGEYDYTSEQVDGKMVYYKNDLKTGSVTEIAQAEWINGSKQPKLGLRKAVIEERKMVYGCKWILGTDFIYDYGLQHDIPRDPMPNGGETNLPYHIYRLTNKSTVERAKPFVDAFMLSWLKIQNAKAKARPKGIKIELDALENMTVAGKQFTPLQALTVYDQTGNIIYKGTGQHGEASRHSPVEEMQGGMGAEYAELIADLNFNINMIQRVTGFNEVFLAQTPDPNQPVKTAQMAVQATNNALYGIQQACRNIHVRTVKSSACRFQLMSRYGGLQGFDMAISEPMRKVIEYSDDLSAYQYGIKIVARPTDEQKAKIEGAALQAMNTRDASGIGQITYGDYLFVMRILDGGNLKYAEAVLSHRIEKNMMKKHQLSISLQRENAQVQMESNAAAEEGKRSTLSFETDEKIRFEEAMGRITIQVDNNKLEKMKQIEVIKTEGKVRQTDRQTQGKLASAVIQASRKEEEATAAEEEAED